MLIETITLAQILNPKQPIQPPPLPTPIVKVEPQPEKKKPKPVTYTVKRGDSLTKIAKKHKTTAKRLWAYNRQLKHQDRLGIGVKIKIPRQGVKLAPRAFKKPKIVIYTSLPLKRRVATVRSLQRGSSAPAGWYEWGWCTYGAWSLAPWVGQWHNANTWDESARADGHIVSSTPIVGAVFVDNGGSMGHVGVVIGVSGGNVTVKEMNYKGFGVWSTRTEPASSFVYIYP